MPGPQRRVEPPEGHGRGDRDPVLPVLGGDPSPPLREGGGGAAASRPPHGERPCDPPQAEPPRVRASRLRPLRDRLRVVVPHPQRLRLRRPSIEEALLHGLRPPLARWPRLVPMAGAVPGRTRPEGRPRAARGRAREVLPLREPSRRADEEHGEAALQGQRLRLQAEGGRRHRVLGDDAGRLAQDGQLRLRADGDAGRQGARVHQEDLLPDRAVAHRGDRLGRRAHPQGGAAGPFRGPLSEALASRMPPPPGLPRRRLPRDQGPRPLGHRPVQARGELHRGAVPDGDLQEPEGRGAAPTEETPGSMGLERGYIPATYTEDYGNLPRNPFDRTEHNKE